MSKGGNGGKKIALCSSIKCPHHQLHGLPCIHSVSGSVPPLDPLHAVAALLPIPYHTVTHPILLHGHFAPIPYHTIPHTLPPMEVAPCGDQARGGTFGTHSNVIQPPRVDPGVEGLRRVRELKLEAQNNVQWCSTRTCKAPRVRWCETDVNGIASKSGLSAGASAWRPVLEGYLRGRLHPLHPMTLVEHWSGCGVRKARRKELVGVIARAIGPTSQLRITKTRPTCLRRVPISKMSANPILSHFQGDESPGT
ncbi:hypothetical protein DFH08DRAFT_827413 [Mycena albidolilacea]|uniref:Uncharacterized protein n=1 Tax=Mycena albidolilacea TaxID=1033008 RepID=A0AAD7E756_9AGAR|nr:hypothetical protein DFH08DRAFT_827413 [Mycena albidolilacea]